MSESYCSPHREDVFKKTGSCLNKKELNILAKEANAQNANSLSHAFKQYCKGKLNKDYCWVQSPIVKKNTSLYNVLSKNYRPTKPVQWYLNRYEWLTNDNIQNVMKQYEIKHNDFVFLGVVARDFESYCFVKSICGIDVRKLIEQKKSKFAFVVNLDKHDQPGSHWVALFCSLQVGTSKFGIGYYDSGGYQPPVEICNFMQKIRDQVKAIFPNEYQNFKCKYNNDKHQFKNSECGMFSMLYIINCLENPNDTFHKSRQSIGHDNDVHKFRDKLYKPNIKIVS